MKLQSQDPFILLNRDTDRVSTITLNRSADRNVLSAGMLDALSRALDQIAKDDQTRVLIINAMGPGYCPGHDLREINKHLGDEDSGRAFNTALFNSCAKVMYQIRSLPQPVIASVHATAVAAGCELVATCDLAIASKEARFGVNGINVGLFCSTPAVALTRNINRKRAFELLTTGRLIDAQEALDIGLVNRVCSADKLADEVILLARTIADKPLEALAIGKSTFYQQISLAVEEAYPLASTAMVKNLNLTVAQEGILAFTEKRKPNWDLL